ncbi:MlaD family protein [Gordonia amicalis]|uniref:MlaD family protein n=1 Tax=Gordonia amicalis TaxID=89053 RepID=A0AAE4R702_9ACTN|nr:MULTISPECIES: MlaD family protein [Gordonia]ATD71379.1 MCE family protein [Gordonia sp. 1D]MBA5849597.1 MCE family protein [Gordonia amicalis]MCR8896363.1 MlaD family protein [Gordonia sp. GONU]MCZ0913658.1 MlaD family protein [Gordonia amicalis]MCZ4580162.1 MlaD family protein [Gordonia amicalis]
MTSASLGRTVAEPARRRSRMRRGAVTALLLSALMGLTGCGVLPGLTVEQIPLPAPGGIGDSIRLTANFDNALNLPTRAKVKLNGTDVGQVDTIVAKDYSAIVTMDVSKKTKLPVGTGAELRQATPLGDVFVALLPPPNAPKGFMVDGDTLTGPTSAAATVEDLLISMSGVVDSGSLNSLTVILTELSAAVATNPSDLNGAIRGLTTGIRKLNQSSAQVDRSLANTRILTGQLADGRAQIMASINKLGPALESLNGQIGSILTALDKTQQVTSATNDFLRTDQDNFVEMLGHLSTVLAGLRQAAGPLGSLADNLHTLTPKWIKSTPGSAAAVSSKVYWLNPGVGFDSASRLPELEDIDSGSAALQQTLTRLLARLTGTKGCCG